jgi:hypothetical protein
MREEAAKAAAAVAVDPWQLRLARVRGKIDFFVIGWSASAVRHCWIFLRSHSATELRALFGA